MARPMVSNSWLLGQLADYMSSVTRARRSNDVTSLYRSLELKLHRWLTTERRFCNLWIGSACRILFRCRLWWSLLPVPQLAMDYVVFCHSVSIVGRMGLLLTASGSNRASEKSQDTGLDRCFTRHFCFDPAHLFPDLGNKCKG